MSTQFCPACGAESPSERETCPSCGASLAADEQALGAARRAPFRWPTAALCFAIIAVPLALSQLVPALQPLAFQPRVELRPRDGLPLLDRDQQLLRELAADLSSTQEQLLLRILGGDVVRAPVARGGLARLAWPLLFFAAGGLAAALVFRRRAFREVAVAAGAAALLQLALWAHGLDWRLGLLAADTLWIVTPQSVNALPSGLGALVLLSGFWLAAVGAATGAVGLLERTTGRATCRSCGERFAARPMPAACPHCRLPIDRGRIRWRWVAAGTAGTTCVFALVLGLAGPALGFWDRCSSDELSATCRQARREVRAAQPGGTSWRVFQQQAGGMGRERLYEVVVFHPWKYVLWTALAFVPAPLLLGWRLRRAALATAGAAVPAGWLAAMLTALLFFGFGGFQGAFFESFRIHMLALLAWGIAGAAGAYAGFRLGGLRLPDGTGLDEA
jgi:hypothetical protein